MQTINRSRTIRNRPSGSANYKVDTKKVDTGDRLIVVIDHESKPFRKVYEFAGSDISSKDSIHFTVDDTGTALPIIKWTGIEPLEKSKRAVYSKFELDGQLLVNSFSLYVIETAFKKNNTSILVLQVIAFMRARGAHFLD